MMQDLALIKITKNCFSTNSSRLIYVLLSRVDFCTRIELIEWTGFSYITISRYLQEFSKLELVTNAPGIVFLSEFGREIFLKLHDLFEKEIEFISKNKSNFILNHSLLNE